MINMSKLYIMNLGACQVISSSELLSEIRLNLNNEIAVYVGNCPECDVETIAYAVIGYAWKTGHLVSVVAGSNWIFAERIESSNNKLELSADDSRMLNILSNFGLY